MLFYSKADKLEEIFSIFLLLVMVFLVFLQVIMRYVFQNSLSWSEEVATHIFMWFSWIGASLAVRERSHFRVLMFIDFLKGKKRMFIEVAILLTWFLFCVFLAYQGSKLVRILWKTGQTLSSLPIPMALGYSSVPVGVSLMAIRVLIEIKKLKNEHRN